MDMDPRTKAKHMQAARTMMHLLEGHISQLPKGKSYLDVVLDGVRSATILGMEKFSTEERARATAEAVARLEPREIAFTISPALAAQFQITVDPKPEGLLVGRPGSAVAHSIPWRSEVMSNVPRPPSQQDCGIERSCPRGDA